MPLRANPRVGPGQGLTRGQWRSKAVSPCCFRTDNWTWPSPGVSLNQGDFPGIFLKSKTEVCINDHVLILQIECVCVCAPRCEGGPPHSCPPWTAHSDPRWAPG